MKLFKSKGFTLLEILIAMGAVSVVGLALSQMMLNSNRSLGNVGASTDFNTLVNVIQGVFNNSSICPGAFSNFTFASPLPTGSPLPTPVSVPLPFSVGTTSLIPANGIYTSRISLNTTSGLQFTALQPLNGNNYMATLSLTAIKTNIGNLSSMASPSPNQLAYHNFQIILGLQQTSGNNFAITSCSGMSSNELWQLNSGNNSIFFNAGNVGIGTTNPNGTLDVIGSDGSTHMLAACTSTSSGIGWGVGIGTWNAQGFLDVVNPSTQSHLLTATTSGIGVGTTNPISPLHVHGSYNMSSGGGITLDANSNNPPDYTLQIYPYGLQTNYVGYAFQTFSFGGGGSTNMNMAFGLNGNVGIGTKTPAKTLDVNGSANVSGTLTAGQIVLHCHTVKAMNQIDVQCDTGVATGGGADCESTGGQFLFYSGPSDPNGWGALCALGYNNGYTTNNGNAPWQIWVRCCQ